jgi:hypothetical protein
MVILLNPDAPVNSKIEDDSTKGKVLQYLKTCPVVVSVPVKVQDKHSGPNKSLIYPLVWFSDGTWLWSSEVVRYFERYNLDLPSKFLSDAVSTSGGLPSISPDDLEEIRAIAVSSSSVEVASPTEIFHKDRVRDALVKTINLAINKERGAFTSSWESLKDVDTAMKGLQELTTRASRKLLFEIEQKTPDINPVGVPCSHDTLFPVSFEIANEVSLWSRGLKTDELLDLPTRIFYTILCIGAWVSYLSGPDKAVDVRDFLK